MVMQPFLAPSARWIWVVSTAMLLPMLRPARATLSAGLLARLAMHVAQAPFMWDSCYWCALLDTGLIVAALLAGPRDGDFVDMAASMTRRQMAIFYMAAGFWKVNTAFLDPTHSCGTLVIVQLLSHWLPPALRPLPLMQLVAGAAPYLVITGELTITLLLFAPHAACHRLALLLVLLLHGGICLTPFPNQIPTFSIICLSRVLFAAAPRATAAAVAEAFTPPRSAAGFGWRLLCGACVATSASLNTNPAIKVNFAIVYYTALSCLAVRVLTATTPWGDAGGSSEERAGGAGGTGDGSARGRGRLARLARASVVGATVFAVFGLQILGVMDGVASPFAQVRLHGGSNHLLLPVALLQPVLGGGIVRIEASSSTFLNSLYPGDISSEIDPRSREQLRLVGHTGRQYNPTVRRVLGEEIRALMPRWQPRSGEPFVPYTLPALELRRVLAEARERNESFSLEYSVLPGSRGDEEWRRSASSARVTLVEDGRGGRTCTVVVAAHGKGTWCGAGDLALAPPPSAWERRVMLYFPLAIEPGAAQLPCAD